jgi:hypothetical protein
MEFRYSSLYASNVVTKVFNTDLNSPLVGQFTPFCSDQVRSCAYLMRALQYQGSVHLLAILFLKLDSFSLLPLKHLLAILKKDLQTSSYGHTCPQWSEYPVQYVFVAHAYSLHFQLEWCELNELFFSNFLVNFHFHFSILGHTSEIVSYK